MKLSIEHVHFRCRHDVIAAAASEPEASQQGSK